MRGHFTTGQAISTKFCRVERSSLHSLITDGKCARERAGVGKATKKAAKETCCQNVVHQPLSHDHHPKIAFAAVRTVAIIERTLLDLLSDTVLRKDLPGRRRTPAVEVLEETISEDAQLLRATNPGYSATSIHNNVPKAFSGRLQCRVY